MALVKPEFLDAAFFCFRVGGVRKGEDSRKEFAGTTGLRSGGAGGGA